MQFTQSQFHYGDLTHEKLKYDFLLQHRRPAFHPRDSIEKKLIMNQNNLKIKVSQLIIHFQLFIKRSLI